MGGLDYIVILFYICTIFVVGGIYGTKVKNKNDMFVAGGHAPWWVSGVSGFMTMFSAGTFVVWGGIAYKHGLVAVSINMCYGIAALLVGYFVAGHWRKLGISTPAEYLQLRFGKKAIHFYTWTMMLYRMGGTAVALYSLAVVVTALIPIESQIFLRDVATGNLSLTWAVVILGTIVVIYTMAGGLWAVLMTDVLQFIVLNLAVIFIVPLMFMEIGGIGEFIASAPDDFFLPTSGGFTWFFLGGWVAIHFFMIGAEWAFVQRYLSVPDETEAKKSAYLFGILYLVSPLLWLLPPLLYRGIDPNANPEEAYILASRTVLPPGMLGLMVAAMFSATASLMSSQLNVFAGVLTSDFYNNLLHPRASDKHIVRVGRIMTVVLGAALILIGVSVPAMGGAEAVILSITSLLVGPLLLPSIWGLFSKRLTASAIWLTALISFAIGFLLKFGFANGAWLADIGALAGFADFLAANTKSVDIFSGVVVPLLIILIVQWRTKDQVSQGWKNVQQKTAEYEKAPKGRPSSLPVRIIAWTIGSYAVLMLALGIINRNTVLYIFAFVLFVIAALAGWAAFHLVKKSAV